jgi:photosystem II stability/assembly factor-like uncharacterized protein
MPSGVRRAAPSTLIFSLLLVFPSLDVVAESRGLTISRVALDPSDTNTVYAASNQGLFKSLDAGQSWSEINNGLPPHPSIDELDLSFSTTLDVRGFALDPNNPQVLYAGLIPAYMRLLDGEFIWVEGGTFKSTDGGEQWALFGKQGGRLFPLDLAVDPTDSETIYGAGGVFMKTTNGGADWRTRGFAPYGSPGSIALDPRDSNTLYVGLSGNELAEHGIYKSFNGGEDWFRLDFPRGRTAAAPVVAIDPRSPDTLYATFFQYASVTGTYKSTDGGESWSQLTRLGYHCVIIDPNGPDTLYACEWNGVAKSTDAGATWKLYRTGLQGGFRLVISLAIDPDDSLTLYAGTFPDQGVFKSVDGGESWFVLGP